MHLSNLEIAARYRRIPIEAKATVANYHQGDEDFYLSLSSTNEKNKRTRHSSSHCLFSAHSLFLFLVLCLSLAWFQCCHLFIGKSLGLRVTAVHTVERRASETIFNTFWHTRESTSLRSTVCIGEQRGKKRLEILESTRASSEQPRWVSST